MIKVLPINKNVNNNPRDTYFFEVSLGYGEHCDDTFTDSRVIINDEKALHPKYENDDPENGFQIDDAGFPDFNTYITSEEAEKMYLLFTRIVKKSDDEHITLNDGVDETWFKKYYHMTQKEIDEFRTYYEKYEVSLFNPQIDHNWYGLVSCRIIYYDIDGNRHKCEVC